MAQEPEDASSGGPLGLTPGQVVQEFGYDSDCDEQVRADIAATTGLPLEPEDFNDVIDVALIWWRADDGDVHDLADQLTDAMVTLEDGGLIWLLAPKAGKPEHVLPAEVEEAATTAGLHLTSTLALPPSWSAFRLTSRGRGR